MLLWDGLIMQGLLAGIIAVALGITAQTLRPGETEFLVSIFRPMLAVQSSQLLFAEGLRLYERYQLSWYDSLIVAAALEAQCGVLYSEDMRHRQMFGDLRIANPFR